MLSEFSERVGETYSPDDVLPRMAQLVGEATGATGRGVWLRSATSCGRRASWPDGAPAAPACRFGDDASDFGGRRVEVRHQGELLGAITLTVRRTIR